MADLTHWDPFGELFSIRDSVNRMFNGQYWQPTVDIADRREELILRADLPGLDQKDIEVVVDEDSVMLKGETSVEKAENESSYYRRERSTGSFTRVIPLNAAVKPEEATATYKNGLLEIILPKAEHVKPRSRRLEIQ